MQGRPSGFGSRVQRVAGSVLAACVMTLAACDKGSDITDPPQIPGNPPPNPQVKGTAFIFDVNVKSRTVKVTAPRTSLSSLPDGRVAGTNDGPEFSVVGPQFSLIGGDVIELQTGAFEITSGGGFSSGTIPVGPCPGGSPAAVPGKLCVEFDIAVINELLGVQLVGPAVFPTPPPGTTGPLMFPFEITLTQTSGGATTGGPQGNDVIVEQPNTGEVSVNEEWSGNPFNFFNDTACPAGDGTLQNGSDCYRYEEVTPTPLAGGAISDAKRVGFYIDPTVGDFRVRVLLAADLQNQSGGVASGTVAGSVTSPQLGALNGVQLSVTGGQAGSTDATGAYSIANVGIGSRTVTITGGLPAGCTTPAPQTTSVTNGATSTVNFSVTCPVPSGTITGTISSSLGGGIAGVSVVVTPAGGSALSAASTDASGVYSKSGVTLGTPSGTGSIALSGLPAGCTDPGATPYSGLTNGGTLTVDITVSCTPPPSAYFLNGTWSGTDATRAYTLTYDLTQRDDPAIPGADDLFVISGTTTYDVAKLSFTGSANVAGSLLQNQGSNQTSPGSIAWQNFDTDVAKATGTVGVIIFNFNVLAGATGTVTPTTVFGPVDDVQSESGVDYKPNTIIQDATLTLP